MRLGNRTARKVLVAVGCVALLALGAYFLTIRNLDRAFAEADFAPLMKRVKAASAGLVVVQQASKQATSTQPPLVTNQKDPVSLASNAKLFDVWLSSAQIAEATLKATVGGSWVRSTDNAAYLPADRRHDPWNHALCVLRRGDTVAVVSGGPNASSSPACGDISMSEGELARLPHARLLETPGGNLILVVHGPRPQAGTPPS